MYYMNPNLYIHDEDRKALNALKAVPGFTALTKAFMKNWSEQLFHVQAMATMIRLGPDQLPKYYEMLLPICRKLGIPVPELYLELDVEPNAYTIGDTKPFVVMTSGLLESMPEELIPTVLAHECGHIACHHCLYTTIGRMILSNANGLLSDFLGNNNLISSSLEMAFAYWMRCSELSADRAAALYEGSADKIVRTCMASSGYTKNIMGVANANAFMAQAEEYVQIRKEKLRNKVMEFYLFNLWSHPINAVRAYECNKWASTEHFGKLKKYVNACGQLALPEGGTPDTKAIAIYMQELPMEVNDDIYVGKSVDEVQAAMENQGFTNVKIVQNPVSRNGAGNRQVMSIRIGQQVGFKMCQWFSVNDEVLIEYYEPLTPEQIAAAHPGQCQTPFSAAGLRGCGYAYVIQKMKEAGFENFETVQQKVSKKKLFDFDGKTARISINGQMDFKDGEWFSKDALIHITYNVYPQ